jgi:hypothetical protein
MTWLAERRPPAFLVAGAVAVVTSLLDQPGQARLVGVREELDEAKRRD